MVETRGPVESNDPASSIDQYCLFVSNEATKAVQLILKL